MASYKYLAGRVPCGNDGFFEDSQPARARFACFYTDDEVYTAQGHGKEAHASMWLHRACNYAAQGLQLYCTGAAIMLHRACNYTAQGLQLYRTWPTLSTYGGPR